MTFWQVLLWLLMMGVMAYFNLLFAVCVWWEAGAGSKRWIKPLLGMVALISAMIFLAYHPTFPFGWLNAIPPLPTFTVNTHAG